MTTTAIGSTLNTSSSGTSYLTSTISGINTAALISNAVTAKLVPKTQITDQVTTNTNKITAYQALQTQATDLQTAVNKLKSDSLLGNDFTAKSLSYTTSDGTDPSAILTATTTTGAQAGTYNIVVGQLATPQIVTSDVQASQTAALGYTGSFTIGEPGKTAATINVTSGMTLQQLRNAINVTTTTSGVSADILQLSPTQFKLILSGADTNQSITVGGVTGTDVLHSLGVTNTGGAFQHISQPAQPASITLNTETVTSDTNTLTGVLTGLNLNLVNSAPGTTVTVTAGNNVAGIISDVNDITTAYNKLYDSIAAYQKTNADGSVDSGAYLYGETLPTALLHNVQGLLSGAYGTGTTYNGLHSLGITADDSNHLSVNAVTLNTALTTNYNEVQSIFATNASGSSVGLADQLSSVLDGYSNPVTGSFITAIKQFQATDITLNAKADTIQQQADAYQQQLINKYAQMEAALKTAETVKSKIDAILLGSTPTH